MSDVFALERARRASALRLVDGYGRVTREGQRAAAHRLPLVLSYRCHTGNPVRLSLDEEVTSVGADASNDLVVEDPRASSFHCRVLRRLDGRLWVKDLGSTNGTFVDGNRITEAELPPGATLRIGDADVRVEHETHTGRPPQLPGLVTHDPVLAPVIDLLRRTSPTLVSILLLGESGCGKEVAARAVHELSPRARGPFVPVNCGAISAELAEAELFGHEKGAFTGAIGSAPGAFGAADGGTLFLDEVGDLPLPLQVKLLRALEASEIKPVGAGRPRKVDVRIVCATHRDLRARVAKGLFREDLFYRLAGVSVQLPPLRERPLDILPLSERFLSEVGDGRDRQLSADARQALLGHRWPGNVRELRNVIRLAVLLGDGQTVRASALRFENPYVAKVEDFAVGKDKTAWRCSEPDPTGRGPMPSVAIDWIDLRGRSLADLEALAIRASWQRHGGNRKAMMRELGLSKSSLLRKLDALGLRGQAVAEGDDE